MCRAFTDKELLNRRQQREQRIFSRLSLCLLSDFIFCVAILAGNFGFDRGLDA